MKTILALQLIILLTIGTSWVVNLTKLVNSDWEAPYKEEVIHSAGVIIPPISLVTSWLDLGPEEKQEVK